MQIIFNHKIGAVVKGAINATDRMTGARIFCVDTDDYTIMGRAFTEGKMGGKFNSDTFYYVVPKHLAKGAKLDVIAVLGKEQKWDVEPEEVIINFKFEMGGFVRGADGIKNPNTGEILIQNKKEKYLVLGRSFNEGAIGASITANTIYYVTPVHNKVLFKKDKTNPKVYTVKESDLQQWKPESKNISL